MKKSEALNILGLHEGASEEDIKKAHRKKVIENHPDRFQDPTKKAQAEEKTKLINEARDVLLSGRWDPEFSSGAGSYGNPYRSPYGNPYQQGPTRGGAQQGDEWPFGFDPNTWTVWGAPNQQGGNRQGTYDPFNPFAQQQASVDAATRAKQEAESDIKVGVAMLVVKLVVCGGLALTGQWLAAALIWSILTFMLLAAGRFGGCIWLFLFPVFFMFSDMIAMANAQQGNIAVIIPIAALFAVAIGFDIRDFREAYRRYRVTSGKKTWKEKRAANKRDKREAKNKAKAAKAQAKADAKKAKHAD